MHWLLYLLLLIIECCGLFLVILTLPGLWLMVAASAVYAWLTHARFLGARSLIALALLALIGEILETVLGGAGAKKAGGGKAAIFGAIIGALLGGIFLSFLIPIPVLGSLIGVCLGSFLGAAAMQLLASGDPLQSLEVGAGAAQGRFIGILTKLTLGVTMILLTLIAAWP